MKPMKVIVSHDVDHLFLSEHLLDGVLLKYGVRAIAELANGVLSPNDFGHRVGDLFRKQWHHVDELMDFDEANGIPSTFFFAMRNGVALNYDLTMAEPIIKRVIDRGFGCGVHGIDYTNQQKMDAEYQSFSRISGLTRFGIRMHYLHSDPMTLEKISRAGYLFDSSVFSDQRPYQIGDLWEFPLNIMDSHEFYNGKSVQTEKIDQIVHKTLDRIAKFAQEDYPLVTLLSHDRYFSASFKTYEDWYKQIICFMKERGFVFIDFQDGIKELTRKPA